jgi:hypothetical protein
MQRKSLFLSVYLFTAACGCITNSGTSASKAPEPVAEDLKKQQDPLAGVRVKAELQKKMYDELNADKTYTNAYGLFSEGGWSDAGQTWVLTNADFSQVRTVRIAPNKDTPEVVTPAKENLTVLKGAVGQISELQAIEENMFDGLIFEFTKLSRNGDAVVLEKNIYIKSTDLTKHPQHNILVNAFSSLTGS